jgi:hypothetical protein
MSKIFVISTSGKEDINKTMMAINFALGARDNAKAEVSVMFLGRGVMALLKNSGNSEAMLNLINKMKNDGIEVTYCKVSLKGMGLTSDLIFDGIKDVMGGVETAKRIDSEYSVVTF